MIRVLCVLLLAVAVSAVEVAGVDFRQRDKAAHAGAGFAIASVTAHVLRARSDAGPFPRWLVSVAAGATLGLALETVGVRESEDVIATTLGGIAGATVHEGVELMCGRDRAAVAWSVRF